MSAREERFWSKVDKTDTCWLWVSRMFWDGYGNFYADSSRPSMRAHRFAYELLVGPIPEGLVIDHLCRVRSCVNPDHLEPVTNQENLRRAMSTHCPQGHEFTDENTWCDKRGHRQCRTCHRARSKIRNLAKFDCEYCGKKRNLTKRLQHMRAMHPEVLA